MNEKNFSNLHNTIFVSMLNIKLFLILTILGGGFVMAQDGISIIPKPVNTNITEGEFVFSSYMKIFTANSELIEEAALMNVYLKKQHSTELEIAQTRPENDFIELVFEPEFSHEEYILEIFPRHIEIRGGKAGVFYGIQTLLQLLPPKIKTSADIPCLRIHDYPRFQWRGMHLDVSRHFFPKEFIFRYIDFLAMYKMNTFHWHLTDDQGWRIEIKKYPLLTELGAWRKGTLIGHSSDEELKKDTAVYGGFYTQEDIREIVDYANSRHITIVPEIEMPGHSMAALRAYPEFSCSGKQKDVATSWGVFDHVFCTRDEVFEFLENILTEVMDLFPGTYIHVGGDECPKTMWKKCPHCQARIKSEELQDEYELQSYFITRIEKFINSKGRKLIGWDEILEGGLAPNAAVMSWRGTEGGIEAARSGHYVVMTPGSHCYFDHYQGDPTNEPLAIGGYTTVEKVYSYEPVPDELTAEESKYIMGAQGNVWTEYMNNEKHVEYMIFPRLCALAEVVWTPADKKNYTDFRSRLLTHFDYFDVRKINYAKSIFEIKKKVIHDPDKRKIFLELSQEFSMGDIMYAVETGAATRKLPQKYINPIPINESCVVYASVTDSKGNKRGLAEQKFDISKSTGANISLTFEPSSYYNYGGALTLVDGIRGRIPWNGKEWLGFSNTNFEAIVDLGKTERISSVSVHVLKAEASWIYLPVEMQVFFSDDGVNFFQKGMLSAGDIVKAGNLLTIRTDDLSTRYVKVTLERAGVIGTGKPGEGHNAWLFVSEIEVR